ncbi:uncharacterized protein N0V89_011462 [Didymosphaeria variabile]|uniref:S-adenosyl-L-methionine-dependent methyltransferase n=1 Tax=Didymosphaeria variabile TaxID=1932322 RepID=A0A9W9C5C2_9PLEO|nr:uncharacterized protein N0V89_011462 [Didymosphaeria variabile]KAJ4345332.1 hypothetical protein N0V89_011462 [Didymosphaeria variabile]
MSEARNLIAQLTSLSQQSDFDTNAATLASTLHLAKQLQLATQKPEDAAIELCFHVGPLHERDKLVAGQASGVSATGLAEESGCKENLLVRLLRPLSALDFVQEASEDLWTPTPITKAMCLPPVEAAHIHFWDQGTTAAVKMPAYFKKTAYRQPEDPRDGLFQYSFGTDKEAFEFWSLQPAVIDNFNTCMTGIRGSRPSWIEWWPVEQRILNEGLSNEPSEVLLVDVAGGRGHDVQAFGKKFEACKGRLVLEDLPAVIGDIKQLDERVERVEYDFFTSQPIVGILSRTAAAMKPGYSKLLLNDFILPNRDCPLFPTGFDLQMMAMHAAQERTESQWQNLLETAGLKLVQLWIPPGGGEGIVEAELPPTH